MGEGGGLDFKRSLKLLGYTVQFLYKNLVTLNCSCRFLWLNPGARGEHLTSQLSWILYCFSSMES